ncbi:MAG: hypothetical protein ACKO04_02625 [Actinomycetes bacterium]
MPHDRSTAGPAKGPARLPDLVRELEARLARLDRATATLVAAESHADRLVGAVTTELRRVADAGGVVVPVMVPPAARHARALHPAVVEAEHIVRARALELAAQQRRADRWAAAVEPGVVGLLGTAVALVVGLAMSMGAGRLPGDAVSRAAAAQTMVAGRDPHPEAIGVIWGPFPTLFEVPFVLFRHLWLGWTSGAVAATAVSAVCFGLLLAQVVRWARDGGAPRWMRLVGVALLAAHPLLLLYGGNGMSECCWMLFLVVAVRSLCKWWEHDDVVALTLAGLALGAAYLTRYETVAAVAAAALLVGVVAWRRAPSDSRTVGGKDRAWASGVDLAVVLFPPAAAFLGWAFASWVVIGEPFAQFTSQYGNSALVAASQAGNAELVGDLSAAGRLWFFLRQALVAAPALLLVVALALWVGGRAARRTAVAVAVVGAPLVLQCLFAVQGQTFPWFRYVVPAVLLSVLVALAAGGASAWVADRRWVRPLLVAALVPGVVMSWSTVAARDLASTDDGRLLDGAVAAATGQPVARGESPLWRAQRVAADINRLGGAAPGAVLTDTSSTDAVLAASPRPDLFVVPADRDFLAVVADPAIFGVRYVLLRGPSTPGDAVVRAYPDLWDRTDHPLARPIRSWGRPEDPAGQFRLFAVRSPRVEPRATPTEVPGR